MKILQIIPQFVVAGAETMCEKLIYELANLNCEVLVVSLYHTKTEITKRLEDKGIKIIYLDKKAGFDFSQILKLYKLFKKENPDVVHTHLYALKYVAVSSFFARVPVKVHTIHSVAKKESGKVTRILNKILFKNGMVIPVSLSREVQKTVTEEYSISEKMSPYIYNGMPIEEYTPKTDYSFGEKIRILHVGRFSPEKNHKRLVEAFEIVNKRYPHTQLISAGSGDLLDEIKLFVTEKELEKTVDFKGIVTNISELMSNVDMFCMTSDYEGIPMTIIEAMASALPIVATNVGGVPDMIEDGKEGLLCSCDAQNVADSLIRLIKDETLRKKIGQAAHIKSEEFSSGKMAKHYYNLYKEKLKK